MKKKNGNSFIAIEIGYPSQSRNRCSPSYRQTGYVVVKALFSLQEAGINKCTHKQSEFQINTILTCEYSIISAICHVAIGFMCVFRCATKHGSQMIVRWQTVSCYATSYSVAAVTSKVNTRLWYDDWRSLHQSSVCIQRCRSDLSISVCLSLVLCQKG